MIAKTGANYQAAGGYIEFAADNPNGVTIINGEPVPTTLYKGVTGITGYMNVEVKKTPASTESIRINKFNTNRSLEGVVYRDYNRVEVLVTAQTIQIPLGFGAAIFVPTGYIPVLDDSSKDIRIIHTSSTYYLFITGENPVAVLSYAEA